MVSDGTGFLNFVGARYFIGPHHLPRVTNTVPVLTLVYSPLTLENLESRYIQAHEVQYCSIIDGICHFWNILSLYLEDERT